jgi:hypothetical protein
MERKETSGCDECRESDPEHVNARGREPSASSWCAIRGTNVAGVTGSNMTDHEPRIGQIAKTLNNPTRGVGTIIDAALYTFADSPKP